MIGPSFHIATSDNGGSQILSITGEIDIKTAPAVEAAIAECGSGEVVIDLTGVDFIDSTGLRVLAVARKSLEDDGGALTLCAADDSIVLRTLRLAGLAGEFDIVGSTEALNDRAR